VAEYLGLWLVPAVMAGVWLVGVALTRGRVPMWVIALPMVVCVIVIAGIVVWDSNSPADQTGQGFGPGFGLMIYAITGIFAGAVIAVLNALALLARHLVDRRRQV
jgi:hypothetical protein